MPSVGMADLSAGGRFPHRLALNVWHGPGVKQPPPGVAGLRHFELLVPDGEALDAVHARLGDPMHEGVVSAADPSGTRFTAAVGR